MGQKVRGREEGVCFDLVEVHKEDGIVGVSQARDLGESKGNDPIERVLEVSLLEEIAVATTTAVEDFQASEAFSDSVEKFLHGKIIDLFEKMMTQLKPLMLKQLLPNILSGRSYRKRRLNRHLSRRIQKPLH